MSIVIITGVVCAFYFFAIGNYMDAILSILTVVAPASIWHSDYVESKKQHKQLISLQERVESYGMKVIDNPEWIYAITDAEDHFLFGIRQKDGSVDWGTGIPGPIREQLDKLNKRVGKLEIQKS